MSVCIKVYLIYCRRINHQSFIRLSIEHISFLTNWDVLISIETYCGCVCVRERAYTRILCSCNCKFQICMHMMCVCIEQRPYSWQAVHLTKCNLSVYHHITVDNLSQHNKFSCFCIAVARFRFIYLMFMWLPIRWRFNRYCSLLWMTIVRGAISTKIDCYCASASASVCLMFVQWMVEYNGMECIPCIQLDFPMTFVFIEITDSLRGWEENQILIVTQWDILDLRLYDENKTVIIFLPIDENSVHPQLRRTISYYHWTFASKESLVYVKISFNLAS